MRPEFEPGPFYEVLRCVSLYCCLQHV